MRGHRFLLVILAGALLGGCPSSDEGGQATPDSSKPDAGPPTSQKPVSAPASSAQSTRAAAFTDPQEVKLLQAFNAIYCLYRAEQDPLVVAQRQADLYQQHGFKDAVDYVKLLVDKSRTEKFLSRLERAAKAKGCR